MIEIDGSMMEGGGQLLRMATTYSAIMGEPIVIDNIRAKRRPPGLKPQHFTTLKALAEISGAEVEGLVIGSRCVKFSPGKIFGGSFKFDIGTAGSISLMLQCLAPVASLANRSVELEIIGGTEVKWSPPIHFLKNVVWPVFRRMGFKGHIEVKREGFYPKGGGVVKVNINPINVFKPIVLEERGKIRHVKGVSICGRLPRHVAERQGYSAESRLREKGYDVEMDIRVVENPPPISPGSVIVLWAVGKKQPVYLGADSLGERGKPAERVGKEAAENIIHQLRTGTSVDYHTADHLVLPCSLADGLSSFTTSKLTLHTLTAVELAKMMAGTKIHIKGVEGKPGKVVFQGSNPGR